MQEKRAMKKVDVILLNLFSLIVSITFAQWTSVGAPDFTSTNAAIGDKFGYTIELTDNARQIIIGAPASDVDGVVNVFIKVLL